MSQRQAEAAALGNIGLIYSANGELVLSVGASKGVPSKAVSRGGVEVAAYHSAARTRNPCVSSTVQGSWSLDYFIMASLLHFPHRRLAPKASPVDVGSGGMTKIIY